MQEVATELNGVTVTRIIQILHDMISCTLTFLDTGWIISHVCATQQLMLSVFDVIMYHTGMWFSVISGVGLSLIKNK